MIPVVLAGMAAVKTAYDMHQSGQMDERAKKKSVKAMTLMAESKAEREEMEEKVKESLLKLANRKRAILQTSISRFLNIYAQIKKIDFVESDGIKELDHMTPQVIDEVQYSVMVAKEKMSDAEAMVSMSLMGLGISAAGAMAGGVSLGIGAVGSGSVGLVETAGTALSGVFTVGGLLSAGIFASAVISGSIKKDSERNLDYAKLYAKQAEVVRTQNQTLSLSYEAIDERSKLLTDVLTKLNVFFLSSLNNVSEIIDKNGMDKSLYTYQEREALAVCINLAVAVKKLLDTPLIDTQGEIAKQSQEAIDFGNQCIEKMASLI